MTRTKKGELQQGIESEKVRYRMNMGYFVLEPSNHTTVPLKGGGFGKVVEGNPLTIYRDGTRREMGVTPQFDPSIKEQAEIIRRIDEFIVNEPRGARRLGLVKVNAELLTPPGGLSKWYELPADKIEALIDGTGIDLTHAMKYELQNDDPRSDVIAVIERIAAESARKASDSVDVAPVL